MQLTPIGPDFDVRSDVLEYSFATDVIQLVGGRVLALWQEYSFARTASDSGLTMDDIFARLYEADGSPVGDYFRVNANELSIQTYASATALDDGGFLVAWQTCAIGTTYLNPQIIVARQFDASGTAQTGDFTVAAAVGEEVNSPELINLGNGTLMLTYVEDLPHPAPWTLKGVILNATGTPTGTPFEIGTAKMYSKAQSAVVLDNGNVLVTWSGEDSDNMGVFARVLTSAGVPVTDAIQVNTHVAWQQTYPKTAVMADGTAMVVWQDGIVGDYNDVYARRMAADGSFLTDPFVVETIHTGGDQSRPDIIALADGGFLIAWQTGNTWSEYDVVARRYDANGQPIDIETTLSSAAGGPEGFAPQLLQLQDGRIAAFWEAFTWGSTSDMVMRLFEAQSFGTVDADTMQGGIANDWIEGQAGNDLLRGGDGNDLLYGDDGFDTLAGNDGNDTLSGGADADTLFGGNDDDDLNGDGGADSVNGGTGNDILRGGDGNDTLDGERGADTLAGNDGDDVLYGGGDADKLFGGSGNDSLDGGSGADRVFGDAGNDTLRGGTGENELHGGSGDDRIYGGSDADQMFGDSGNDRMVGYNGADSMLGGSGKDTLYGNDGDDTLSGETGDDWASGGNGDDVMLGGAGDDTMRGGNGADQMYGDEDNDVIAGNLGNDMLYGGAGDDRMFGGDDDDMLDGGAGSDVMAGGVGADVFVFNSVGDSPHGTTRDTITDFQAGVDRIDLSGFGGLTFVDSYTGAGNEVRYDDSTGRLYINLDGDSVSDFSVDLGAGAGLTEIDLIL